MRCRDILPEESGTGAGSRVAYSNLPDLARFVMAHLPGEDGALPGRRVLPPETLVQMRAPAARVLGGDVWGLGTQLYAKSGVSDHAFGHDGENYPAISHAIRIDPATRSGIVIAVDLRCNWLYWKAGNPSYIGFRLPQLMRTIGIGSALIVLLVAAWVIWNAHSRRLRAG